MTVALNSTPTFSRTHNSGAYAPLASALLAAVVYLCTLGGTFIYDDVVIIRNDPRISQPELWSQFWTLKYMPGSAEQLFRPLVSMSFAIQWWLHGDRAWAFHLVNVLLHATVAGMVAMLGRRIAGLRAAWVAGLLFAVHPVHVEAVAGLVGRCELACTLATLGGLLIFLNGSLTAWRIAAIGGCFLAAVLSKEQGMLFPLILLAALPARQHLDARNESRGARLGFVFLLSAILCAYIVWRESHVRFWWDHVFLDWEFNPLVRSTGRHRLLMPVVLLGHYTGLLLAPVKLSIDYGAAVIGWKANLGDPYLYLGFASLLAWGALLGRALFARKWDLFLGLMALALSYGMIANALVLIGTNMGERLMYMPSAFFVLVLAITVNDIPRRMLWPGVIACTLLGGVWSMVNAAQWNDRFHFYQQSVVNQPKSIRVYALLFNEYAERNDWDSALRVALKSKSQLPECWEAYQMSVLAYLQIGDLDAASQAIDQGLRLCPTLELRMLSTEVAGRIQERKQRFVPPQNKPFPGA